MINRSIKHGGLNITMNVDIEEFKENIIRPYRNAFSTLKKMVLKRERHIKKLHRGLRNKDNIMFNIYASYKIFLVASKDTSIKRMLILTYLYDVDYAKDDTISNYLRAIGVPGVRYDDIVDLKDKGYIKKTKNSIYFYITDEGKQKVDKMQSMYVSAMKYYLINKRKRNVKNVNKEGLSIRKSCFTDEQKQQRRDSYMKLMKPFWDMKMNHIPKDKVKRIEALGKWISDKKANGEEVEEYYISYMQKWSI